MDAGLEASGGLRAAGAVCQEGLVIFLVGTGEADNLGSNEEALGGNVDADLFIAAADGLQENFAGGQVNLYIKVSLLPD